MVRLHLATTTAMAIFKKSIFVAAPCELQIRFAQNAFQSDIAFKFAFAQFKRTLNSLFLLSVLNTISCAGVCV